MRENVYDKYAISEGQHCYAAATTAVSYQDGPGLGPAKAKCCLKTLTVTEY